MSNKYITVREAAEILSVTSRTVTKYLASGNLKGAKIGKIWRLEEQDVHDFFKEAKNKTAEAIERGEIASDES